MRLLSLTLAAVILLAASASAPDPAATPTRAPALVRTLAPAATPPPMQTVAPTRTPTRAPSPTPTLVLPSQCPQGCTTHVASCDIKANISENGEKIYHTKSDQSYDRTVISPDKGERWFCNEVEAKAAGWRPAAR